MSVFIYVLHCPVSGMVRYVGKAENPLFRFSQHLKNYDKKTTDCANWISDLKSQGLEPKLEIIFHVPDGVDWQQVEIRFIAEYRAAGHPLTNLTKGGEGIDGLNIGSMQKLKASLRKAWSNPISRERRIARMSIAAKEAGNRPEVREKNSAAQKAAWIRKEPKALEQLSFKTSASMKKLWSDPEVKAARLATLHTPEAKAKRYGKRDTPENTAKRAAKLKARWADPVARAKRIAAMCTPEALEKRRVASRAMWARRKREAAEKQTKPA